MLAKSDHFSRKYKQVAQQSQKDRAAGWAIVMAKVEDCNWETIFSGHYRSVFNHCDVIGQLSSRIRWKMQNKGYYAAQAYSMSSRSVSIESPYATSY